MEPLLKIGQAAKIIGVTVQTIRKWDTKGKIQLVRSGTQRMIPLSEVLRMSEKRGQPGNLYLTFHVQDFATAELLKAVAARLIGVTYLDSRDVASIIVSALAHTNGYGEGSCNEGKQTTKA